MLIITILSLLMAATMGWLALRLLREEQRRSEARVAALAAAIDEPSEMFRAALPVTAARPVAQAAEPTVIDLSGDATEPTDAFSPEIADDDRPMFGGAPRLDDDPGAPPSQRSVPWVFVAASVVIVVLAVAGVRAIWSGGAEPAARPAAAATASDAAGSAGGAAGIPVELVSLNHERTADGLVIRGLVRNPAAASVRSGTSASVFLFDGEGGFLGSGRAALDPSKLGAGSEAAFEVRLPDNPAVRRYRVTFRTPDGDVVPHLDRRAGAGAGSGLESTRPGSGLASR